MTNDDVEYIDMSDEEEAPVTIQVEVGDVMEHTSLGHCVVTSNPRERASNYFLKFDIC